MKKPFMSGLVGFGLAVGLAIAPVSAASAAGPASCPSGRVVSFTSAKAFSVRVYTTSNPGTVYSSSKVGSTYKAVTGRQSISEWHVVSGSGVTVGCTA